ncbi:MAG: adenylate kinase family protein [Metamycoplasmataceae bacterium]
MIKKTNLIFLGPPGSGKGTISHEIEKKLGLFHLSTGDIFREEISNQTPLGIEVQNLVNSGKYVPDDITNKIVKNKLEKLHSEKKNFILDGYPRTIDQAKFLNNLSLDKFKIILLKIDEETIIKRLNSRLFCPTCKKTYNSTIYLNNECQSDKTLLIKRKDDEVDAIKKRLEVYEKQTLSLINFYKDSPNYFEVSSNDEIKKIVDKIIKKLSIE